MDNESFHSLYGDKGVIVLEAVYESISRAVRSLLPFIDFPATIELLPTDHIDEWMTENEETIVLASLDTRNRQNVTLEFSTILDESDALKLQWKIDFVEKAITTTPFHSSPLQRVGVRLSINDVEVNVGQLKDGRYTLETLYRIHIRQ